MGQLVVRNIEEAVKERLRDRAKKNGRSMEAEVREILRSAIQATTPATGLGTEIANIFAKTGLDAPIQEWRGHRIRAASFKR